jgi:hypothetical protein
MERASEIDDREASASGRPYFETEKDKKYKLHRIKFKS